MMRVSRASVLPLHAVNSTAAQRLTGSIGTS